MHLADPKNGIMGASAVVASTVSHAVGAALSEKLKKKEKFLLQFLETVPWSKAFHECLNFASHNLPVLFLCEDNGLAVHAKANERRSFSFEKLISAFSIDYFETE